MSGVHDLLAGERIAGSPRLLPARALSCFSSLGCPDLSLEEVTVLAARYGIDCLELRSLEGRMDLPRYFASRPEGWAEAARFLGEQGIPVRVLGTSLKLSENGNEERLEFVEFARLAEALQVPYLRVFGGGKWPVPPDAEAWSRAVDTCHWWNQRRETEGWSCEILLETHDAFSAAGPCLELMRRVESAVALIWDSHHTWRLGRENPAESWERMRAFIRHIHVKDSVGVPSARHPFTYVLPGDGEMPLPELWRVLNAGTYQGAVSLEWEKQWHPYLPGLPAALEDCHRKGWW
jgi:sugar phosphate isomerase/epimerase